MSFRIVLLSALFYLIFISIGHGLSGFLPRKYEVLPPETTVSLAGNSLSLEELVQKYRPSYWLPEQQSSPASERILYEVIEGEKVYTIVYHPEWENEIAPDQTQHIFYAAFRLVKYGFSLKDIEFVQLTINKNSGIIEKILLETINSENTFNSNLQQHYRLLLERTGENTYKKVLSDTEEGAVIKEDFFLMMESEASQLLIATWNHLSKIANIEFKGEGHQQQSFQLTFLTGDIYKRLKLARRSQGDFKTKESPMNTPIIFFVGVIALFYFFVIMSDYTKNKFLSQPEKNEQ